MYPVFWMSGAPGAEYGKCLKGIRPDVFLAGVEMNPMMAKFARSYYDDIFVCPVESLDLPYAVDLINCGEVLEHLENPWNTLDVLIFNGESGRLYCVKCAKRQPLGDRPGFVSWLFSVYPVGTAMCNTRAMVH